MKEEFCDECWYIIELSLKKVSFQTCRNITALEMVKVMKAFHVCMQLGPRLTAVEQSLLKLKSQRMHKPPQNPRPGPNQCTCLLLSTQVNIQLVYNLYTQ